jgi:hypothetical protein
MHANVLAARDSFGDPLLPLNLKSRCEAPLQRESDISKVTENFFWTVEKYFCIGMSTIPKNQCENGRNGQLATLNSRINENYLSKRFLNKALARSLRTLGQFFYASVS